jgi:hypothetical protein
MQILFLFYSPLALFQILNDSGIDPVPNFIRECMIQKNNPDDFGQLNSNRQYCEIRNGVDKKSILWYGAILSKKIILWIF